MTEENKKKKESIIEKLGNSALWKSIFRSGVPRTRRQRMYAVLGNVFFCLSLTSSNNFRMCGTFMFQPNFEKSIC